MSKTQSDADVLDTAEAPERTEGFGVRVEDTLPVEGLRGVAVRAQKGKKGNKPFLSLEFLGEVETETGPVLISISIAEEFPETISGKAATEAFVTKAASHTVGMYIPTADAMCRVTGIGEKRPYGRLIGASPNVAPSLLWGQAVSLRVSHSDRPF